MTSIKEALKIIQRTIKGDQIEAAVVDVGTMMPLGKVVSDALAQLDSADARGIAGAARKCADDLANIVEASVRVAHRTGNSFALDRNKTASMIAGYFTGLLPDASPGKPAAIVTCCITGAIPGDGGACGDCDPCLMGEASMPEPVKRLIAEKNSLLQRIGELEDAVAASPDNGAEKVRHVDLRSANLARQAEWDQDNQITLAYRGNELAGETGEACNVIKKLERERIGIRGSRDTVEHLAEELADVVICADLIAMQAGIDLDKAVRDKFNATSEKMNLKTRLAALHSTSAAGETTSSDGGGCMADFSSGDPNNLKELMAGPSVFDPPSEAADVLAMKEACKRVAEEYTRADNPDVVMVGDLIAAAIDKLSPEVKADASPPDWKQDQAETTRIKPPATAEGGRDEPVAIKPLEWRDHRPDSFPEPAWSAQTPFGYYNIEEVSASDSPAYVVRLHAHHFIADKDSLEDAKGAAQADYEQRIRSALVVHPASPPDVEAIRADERERCATEVERRNWPTVGDARRIASAIRTGGQK